ncbi:hypothetical protein [Streptomyces sp. BE303]|uniref:hypothetical protein n=1 Tax=Streptomyces sp. BE303 TaxID=3002528 RepID=UPI002E78A621|nr:hypothetical protein [Streptomyces sp. BE303]MED7950719.1 hypothetical protein [Streptomyces sp. BE303]
MTPEEELLDAITYRRRQVRDNPAWNSGPDRIYVLLRTATRLRAMEITAGLDTDVPWESVLAQLISWHHELPFGDDECSEKAALEIALAAADISRLASLETSIRAGAYEVRRSRNIFRVRHRWDPAVEVADIHLERRATPRAVPDPSEIELRWISTRPVDSRGGPPIEVLAAAVERAAAEIAAYRQAVPEGHLPDSFALGDGLTVGGMARVMAVLMGLASLCEHTAIRLSRLESTLAHMPLARLHAVLAELCPTVPEEQRILTVERLIFRPGRSSRTSPLVQHGEQIILCPPLLTPRTIDPIVLRSAASDFRRFGPVGRELGERAVAWTEWLGGVPGALVADQVPAYRTDGKLAGDLDVIAVDPVRRVGLCVEIKWPIDAVTSTEVVKIENWATSAARQLDRLRGELRSNMATVDLPVGWPPFDGIDWTWCVGTPQQLCLRPLPVPDMFSTSLRYLHGLGRPSALPQVVDILRKPVLPSEGVHFQITRKTIRIGPRLVHLDTIGMSPYQWQPRFR